MSVEHADEDLAHRYAQPERARQGSEDGEVEPSSEDVKRIGRLASLATKLEEFESRVAQPREQQEDVEDGERSSDRIDSWFARGRERINSMRQALSERTGSIREAMTQGWADFRRLGRVAGRIAIPLVVGAVEAGLEAGGRVIGRARTAVGNRLEAAGGRISETASAMVDVGTNAARWTRDRVANAGDRTLARGSELVAGQLERKVASRLGRRAETAESRQADIRAEAQRASATAQELAAEAQAAAASGDYGMASILMRRAARFQSMSARDEAGADAMTKRVENRRGWKEAAEESVRRRRERATNRRDRVTGRSERRR